MAGKTFNDLNLAAEVRTLALEKIKEVLSEKEPKDKEFYKAVLLRLAGGVLPRLNEHTGKDGEDLFPKPIMEISNVPKDNGNSTNNQPITTD